MYGNIYSEGALEKIVAKGSDIIHELEVTNGPDIVVRARYEKGETKWIKIVATNKMLPKHELIGYATSEADDRKTSMIEVMAAAALDALHEGADVLQIVAQGASRDTETSGWGSGFNTTQASLMGGNGANLGTSNVSSGGTGYSSAWAGMRDKPWIQCNALKAPYKVVGKLPKKQPKKEAKVTVPAKVKKAEAKSSPSTPAKIKKTDENWGTINGVPQKKI
jgi:hypothetical protein